MNDSDAMNDTDAMNDADATNTSPVVVAEGKATIVAKITKRQPKAKKKV